MKDSEKALLQVGAMIQAMRNMAPKGSAINVVFSLGEDTIAVGDLSIEELVAAVGRLRPEDTRHMEGHFNAETGEVSGRFIAPEEIQ